MTTFRTVAEFPAYKLVRKTHYVYRDGDKIAIPYQSQRYGTMYHFFTMGSVAGYAVKNGEDVEEALKRARGFGHELHYAFSTGTMITAEARPQEVAAYVEYGEIIKAFGKFFRLDKANNDNVTLTPMPEYTDEMWIAATVAEVEATA